VVHVHAYSRSQTFYYCVPYVLKIIYSVIFCIAYCLSIVSRKISYRAENAVVVQKNVRMFLAKRKYQPRYRGIATIKTLRGRIEQLNSMGMLT